MGVGGSANSFKIVLALFCTINLFKFYDEKNGKVFVHLI